MPSVPRDEIERRAHTWVNGLSEAVHRLADAHLAPHDVRAAHLDARDRAALAFVLMTVLNYDPASR